jgi:hypothetical protein
MSLAWKCILVIILLIIAWNLLILRDVISNMTFYNLVKRHPHEAYSYFISNDSWHVAHPGKAKNLPDGKWRWQFFLYVPNIGNVKIYCKQDSLEQGQKELRGILEEKEREIKNIAAIAQKGLKEMKEVLYEKELEIRDLNSQTQEEDLDKFRKEYNCLYRELILKYSKYDDDKIDRIKYGALYSDTIHGYSPEESKEIRGEIATSIYEYLAHVEDFSILNEPCVDAGNKISYYGLYAYNSEKKMYANEEELFKIFTIVSFSLAFSVKHGLIELPPL